MNRESNYTFIGALSGGIVGGLYGWYKSANWGEGAGRRIFIGAGIGIVSGGVLGYGVGRATQRTGKQRLSKRYA